MHMHVTILRHRDSSFPDLLEDLATYWNAIWHSDAAAMNGLCLCSESSGKSGKSLTDRSGPNDMSTYPASIGTFSEPVEPIDTSCQRVDETGSIATWKAGELALTSFADRTSPESSSTHAANRALIGSFSG